MPGIVVGTVLPSAWVDSSAKCVFRTRLLAGGALYVGAHFFPAGAARTLCLTMERGSISVSDALELYPSSLCEPSVPDSYGSSEALGRAVSSL